MYLPLTNPTPPILLFKEILFSVDGCFTCMYVSGVCGAQKRILDHLEQALQTVLPYRCWELKPNHLQNIANALS